MTGRIRRLIKVNHTGAHVGLQITLQRRATGWNGGEVAGANEHYRIRTTVSASSTQDLAVNDARRE